jgi:fatty-acyl-CoA synthase
MDSTMQDADLLVSAIFTYGERMFPASLVREYVDGEVVSRTFADVADETRRLASALAGLGVVRGDVVATLAWNTTEHLAAYFAVPSMGAVLHTLNLRLHEEAIGYIADHAGDSVVIVSGDLTPLLAKVLPLTPSVRHVIVVGSPDEPLVAEGVSVHDYAALIAGSVPWQEWPQLPERSAAMLCYTSGTTGRPKGVAYSHRSIQLHTLMACGANAYGMNDAEIAMPVVPMFHANAWGWPHAAWLSGATLALTGRFMQPEHLAAFITEVRPTMSAAVPTIWMGLLAHAREHPELDLSCFRLACVGGSALSPALATAMLETTGLLLRQGWGMTETSPLATYTHLPPGASGVEGLPWVTRSGRVMVGVEIRIVDDAGNPLPWDGTTTGEVELRGNTVTASYLHDDDPDKFRDGWLRTGDLGAVHPDGWLQLKDRLKDGIKSGGEWISTIELENAIAEHPAVAEAAVVGVPDVQWAERPLAWVALRPGAAASAEELREFLAERVAHYWVPDHWSFVDVVPRTSVGKFDKVAIREAWDKQRTAG